MSPTGHCDWRARLAWVGDHCADDPCRLLEWFGYRPWRGNFLARLQDGHGPAFL